MADTVVTPVAEAVVPHVEREIGYLVLFKRDVKSLRIKIEQLSATITHVQQLIDMAKNNDDLIDEPVEKWLARARIVEEEATQLRNEAINVNIWFRGWLSFSRFKLGRRAAKKNLLIQGLLDERNLFGNTVSHRRPAQLLDLVVSGDFGAYPSRESVTKQIFEAMKDENKSLIGVFGMPGIGKTMLARVLADQAKKEKLFDEVVITVISENPDWKKIQGNIAKQLDLKLDEDTTQEDRAKRITGRLKQDKKTLIVLDDIWEDINLSDVGIPYKFFKNRCKVIFTTRKKRACDAMCGAMESEMIEVPVLSKEDSWKLFQKGYGTVVRSTLQEVAKEIVDECGGMPLAIATLAKALRGQSEAGWRDVLRKLKKSIYFDHKDRVFSAIQLSFQLLPGEEQKLCFLMCCMFPEDHKIEMDRMLCYIMGENLLREVESLSEARISLHAIIDELISSCLLLRGEEGYIMMHDVVRDVAISIASKEDNGFIVKAGKVLKEWSNMDRSRCKRLSLMRSKIRFEASYQIKAPYLLTLCLADVGLDFFPPNFFEGMKNLLTLDISRNDFKSLPPSFSCLENLRTLLADDCRYLTNISVIGESRWLEMLHVGGSGYLYIPKEIGKLSKLKLLNLSSGFRGAAPTTISSLSPLEELYTIPIDYCYNASCLSLSEVTLLPFLTVLEICFAVDCVIQDTPTHFGKSLKKFSVMIGYHIDDWDFISLRTRYKKSLYLQTSVSPSSMANWVGVLLERTEYLVLDECEFVEAPLQLVGATQGLYQYRKLIHLSVKHCNGITSLVTDGFEFDKLEQLYIHSCQKLKKVVDTSGSDPLSSNSCANIISKSHLSNSPSYQIFPNLKNIDILRCDELKYVFPMGIFRQLLQLEKLCVQCCDGMEMIVGYESFEDEIDAEKDTVILPRLKYLDLQNLPELKSFSRPGLHIDWPSLETLNVYMCPELAWLPLGSHSVPNLKNFDAIDLTWFNGMQWKDQTIKSRLLSLAPPEFF